MPLNSDESQDRLCAEAQALAASEASPAAIARTLREGSPEVPIHVIAQALLDDAGAQWDVPTVAAALTAEDGLSLPASDAADALYHADIEPENIAVGLLGVPGISPDAVAGILGGGDGLELEDHEVAHALGRGAGLDAATVAHALMAGPWGLAPGEATQALSDGMYLSPDEAAEATRTAGIALEAEEAQGIREFAENLGITIPESAGTIDAIVEAISPQERLALAESDWWEAMPGGEDGTAIPNLLDRLSEDPNDFVRRAVAENLLTRWTAITRLAADPFRDVAVSALGHPGISLDDLRTYAVDPDPEIRAAVASAAACPIHELETLAQDADPAVREAALNNGSDAMLLRYAPDPAAAVREVFDRRRPGSGLIEPPIGEVLAGIVETAKEIGWSPTETTAALWGSFGATTDPRIPTAIVAALAVSAWDVPTITQALYAVNGADWDGDRIARGLRAALGQTPTEIARILTEDLGLCAEDVAWALGSTAGLNLPTAEAARALADGLDLPASEIGTALVNSALGISPVEAARAAQAAAPAQDTNDLSR